MHVLGSHSIRARLYRGIGGLLVLLATSSGLGILLLHHLSSTESTLAKKAQPYLADLSTAAVAAKAAANDERGYLMTGDPKFLDEIREKRDAVVFPTLAHAATVYGTGSKETKAVDAITAGYKKWAAARDAELKLYASDHKGAIELALGSNRDLRKSYEGLIDGAVALADAGVKSSDSNFSSTSNQATWVLLAFLAFALLTGIAFAVRLATSITARLAKLTAVSDRLSVGDVEGLEVEVGGADELGKLGDSMSGVVAAFQEMFSSASAKAA
jgi:methyl-accepting chemotaxis protein